MAGETSGGFSGNTFPNVAGIIAEYNPFHNGHAFHIMEAKKRCNASYCIAAISGDFVQRGAPAIFDKYARTFMALSSGADLVVEMPPHFAVSSAEDFASCGIALLDAMGVVSHVCFGSECGDTAAIMEAADILAKEPEGFSESLKKHAALGLPYPKARQLALSHYLSSCGKPESPASLLSSPNNILGVEYCKALRKRGSSMIPVAVLREGAGYHDKELSGSFSSATGIRKAVFDLYESRARVSPPLPSVPSRSHGDLYEKEQGCAQRGYGDLSSQLPPACLPFLNTATPISANDFSLLLSYRLLELSGQPGGFEIFSDVSPDLALRLKKQVLRFSSFEERITALKTRQYTYTRISRSLLHILLHMTREDMETRKRLGYVSYIRILGFKRESAPLLGAVKRASRLPLITKTADAPRLLPPDALKQFNQDLFCSHIYQSVLEQKSHVRPENEYTRSVVIV